jgi:transposase
LTLNNVFAFRGRRGDLVKLLWSDGDGMCLLTKRLERGRFIWPQAETGSVSLSAAQLSMLLEGIDWRRPERTWQPRMAGELNSSRGLVDRTSAVARPVAVRAKSWHDIRGSRGQQHRLER